MGTSWVSAAFPNPCPFSSISCLGQRPIKLYLICAGTALYRIRRLSPLPYRPVYLDNIIRSLLRCSPRRLRVRRLILACRRSQLHRRPYLRCIPLRRIRPIRFPPNLCSSRVSIPPPPLICEESAFLSTPIERRFPIMCIRFVFLLSFTCAQTKQIYYEEN